MEKLISEWRIERFVSGHDRGTGDPLGRDRVPKKARKDWALQAAEKLISASILERLVTGHGFSRAASAAKSTWALAPAV
jgi:hypothetical protein